MCRVYITVTWPTDNMAWTVFLILETSIQSFFMETWCSFYTGVTFLTLLSPCVTLLLLFQLISVFTALMTASGLCVKLTFIVFPPLHGKYILFSASLGILSSASVFVVRILSFSATLSSTQLCFFASFMPSTQDFSQKQTEDKPPLFTLTVEYLNKLQCCHTVMCLIFYLLIISEKT